METAKIVAITGHSEGLGYTLARLFGKNGYGVKGFSLPDYDITVPESRIRIMAESATADVFINCAYSRLKHDMSQVHMFSEIYNVWKDQPKHIVNIGSVAPSWTTGPFNTERSLYRSGKAALDAIADEAALLRNLCKVTTVRPDWMKSAELTKLEEQYQRKAPNPLEYDDVAELIYQLVEMGDKITVTSISLKGTLT